MSDLYFDETGDLVLSPTGDLAVTDTAWRDDLQQAHIRVMTEEGDYLLYPTLGATLSKLYGMPQNPNTGRYGEELIRLALGREGRFIGKTIVVKGIPTSLQSIRFDIAVLSSNREQIQLSIEQEI